MTANKSLQRARERKMRTHNSDADVRFRGSAPLGCRSAAELKR